ncbi:Ig-like domain-containing protein [Clostridium felsineum]|uniref:Ig-like domain-containing protein n=1 Tax=Clostridium felsineum TaxID=36839 RepID=UPI00214D2F74|nr:Ig-like domain-containing protein [Clostridium felsineum]MCR3757386.1 Ig-like domain-containing protein [Clostridium felsineum]
MNKKLRNTCIASMLLVLGSASSVLAKTTANINHREKNNLSANSVKNVNTYKSEEIKPIHQYTFDNDESNAYFTTDTGSEASSYSFANVNNTGLVNEDGKIFRRFNSDNSQVNISASSMPTKNVSMKFDVRFPQNNTGTSTIISSLDGVNLKLQNNFLNFYITYRNANINRIQSTINLNADASKYLDGKWHTIVLSYAGDYALNGVKMYVDDLVNPIAVGTEQANETNGQGEDFTLGGGTFDLDNFQVYDKILDYTTKITGISLNKETDELKGGETDTLQAIIAPDNTTNKNIKWKSSDTSVATVDSNGKITAIGKGTVQITASSEADSNVSASCTVTVTNAPDPIKPIDEFTFDDDTVQLGGDHLVDTGNYNKNKIPSSYGYAHNTTIIKEDGRIFRRFNGDSSTADIFASSIPAKNISMKFDVRFSQNNTETNTIISTSDGVNLKLENNSLNFYITYHNTNMNRIQSTINLTADASKYLDGKWHTIVLSYAGNYALNGVKMYIDDLVNPVAIGTEQANETNGQSENFTLGSGTFDLDNFQVYDTILN